MPEFLLLHRHEPDECRPAYAAWLGFSSALRRHDTLSTCIDGGHEIWWRVQAENADLALGLLPSYVAARTRAVQVRQVSIP